jgi:hypothetical protein
MSTPLLLLVIVITGLVLWAVKFGGRLPKAFRGRSCQGKGWRTTFPSASKKQIREFLSLFVTAFAFSEGEKLKLSPSDQLLVIYRALYPHRWQADALEFETLSRDLQDRYALRLEGIWNEQLTLGELFAHTLSARARVQ